MFLLAFGWPQLTPPFRIPPPRAQDFIGGAYSLLGIDHTDEALLDVKLALTIKPDFWINYLWKRTVGLSVYERVYSVYMGLGTWGSATLGLATKIPQG